MVQQLSPSPSVIYPLAQDTAETRRLIRQSGFYNPFTRSLFAEAGLGPGMRVLDIGSGAGDVALLAAERVGPAGAVVGIDRNPEVLAVARERAAVAGFTHLTFQVGDLESIPLEEPFDAIVGRLVLMYQPDPAATLRRLARSLRPAGIVAFQDFNLTAESLRTYPETPLWQRVFTWLREAFVRAGAETRMGDKLFAAYLDAGLPRPCLHLASPLGGGPDWEGYALAAGVVRSTLPLLLRYGIATAEEVQIETLEERLRAEIVAANGVVKLPELVSAWARIAYTE